MYNWFSTRLDEMIAVSGYCYYHSLNAQLQLSKASLDQIYDAPADRMASTARAISMLIDEAHAMQNTALVALLERAKDEVYPDGRRDANVLELQTNTERRYQNAT